MREPPPDWFENPEARFRTATFWFWHRIPTDEEIAAQLADMQAKGIGCVMIQARPALERSSYLSPTYLAAYRTACATAERLGIGVTIYDEYGWMSGHGGGRTVDGADHLRERHLFWTSGPAGAPLTVSAIQSPFLDFIGDIGREWLYDGARPVWGEWQVVAAVAHPPAIHDEADLRVLAEPIEVRPLGDDGCRIDYPASTDIPADWIVTVFVAARCLTSRLINYLLPESAERFAQVVYAPLLEAAGGAADGFFFDHPYAGFYTWAEHEGSLGNSLLSDGRHADPAEIAELLSLARDVGPRTVALRAGFLGAYAERMHEAFFGTLARWTRERGVGFSGHELLTHVGGWPLHSGLTGIDSRVMPGVDHFGIDAYRTETAVDAADFAPQLAAKLGDSVARANGRQRCTVEQYATGREAGRPTLAGQWDLTPQRFRLQAIRHLLLGARRILLHAVNVTDGFDRDERLLANPRWDFPPAYNFLPWWEDCGPIFDELARLSAFLEAGEPLRPVALLYPLETIRIEGPAGACGEHFGFWAEALAHSGIGYDILDEGQLELALEPDGRYAVLVLPAVVAFASETNAMRIRDFAKRGGRVLWSGALPETLRNPFQTSALPENGWPSAASPTAHAENPDVAAIRASVATLARPCPDIRFDDEGATWSAIAQLGSSWRIAILNDADHPRRLTLTGAHASHELTILNPSDPGSKCIEIIGERLDGVSLLMPAYGTACLTLARQKTAGEPRGGLASLEDSSSPPVQAVIELVDGWTLEIDGCPAIPIAVDRGWEAQGFPQFSGTGTYRRSIVIPRRQSDTAWHLELAGICVSADLWVDGVFAGRALNSPATFSLCCRPGDTLSIEIRVRNTAANRYHQDMSFAVPDPLPSGLTTPPKLVEIKGDATNLRMRS
ncbi:hypothetical protein NS365_17885 [Aureimonas ureilytica]|uniref:Carbohydrate-binding protein n=1 Tax=Aureimonas ureilytica TaxID=401562 RepID=A0A175RKZ5_9HYPH|nr:hypothetical protein [Aureimonas ureilytica]KTR03654.1 hypothetical protein NS365_17885 [Aureimonas ureilytica]